MEYQARYLYSELAKAIDAKKRCEAKPEQYAEAIEQWEETIKLLTDLLPSGSGFDSGTKLDEDASHAEKLVLYTSFHHMNDGGYYSGWTEHTVTVTPSFSGINLRISGRNVNDIKEYMHEEFQHALTQDVTYELFREHYPQFTIVTEWEFSCPFCHAEWKNENSAHPHYCSQFPNQKKEAPFLYQPKNEKHTSIVNGQRMPDYQTARDTAARLMHEAWASKLKGS